MPRKGIGKIRLLRRSKFGYSAFEHPGCFEQPGCFGKSSGRKGKTLVDKSGHNVRRMFGAIAHRYDFLNHFLSLGTDLYWRWRTVRALKLHGDSPLLDVCTGTGDLAFAFRKKLPANQPVVGSDFTHEMLKLANQKLSRRKSNDQSVAFLEADTQQLPFPDDLFQVVSVAFGIRNVSETKKGLAEMIRVCQPDGHILILEFTTPKMPVLKQLYRWYFRNVLPRIGQFFARNRHSAYRYLPESVAEFPEREEFTKLMRETGLENVTYRSLTFGIATLYQGQKSASRNGMT